MAKRVCILSDLDCNGYDMRVRYRFNPGRKHLSSILIVVWTSSSWLYTSVRSRTRTDRCQYYYERTTYLRDRVGRKNIIVLIDVTFFFGRYSLGTVYRESVFSTFIDMLFRFGRSPLKTVLCKIFGAVCWKKFIFRLIYYIDRFGLFSCF